MAISRRQQQLTFQSLHKALNQKSFGGSLLKGNPKVARPISTKKAMHLVLRSSLARGERSMLKPERARRIQKLIYVQADRFGVRVYRYSNSGNHLHLSVKASSRMEFSNYLRAITGLIARITLGVERGTPLRLLRGELRKFWDARPFTRIVEWGKDYIRVSKYLMQNTLEAIGFIDYEPRAYRYPS